MARLPAAGGIVTDRSVVIERGRVDRSRPILLKNSTRSFGVKVDMEDDLIDRVWIDDRDAGKGSMAPANTHSRPHLEFFNRIDPLLTISYANRLTQQSSPCPSPATRRCVKREARHGR